MLGFKRNNRTGMHMEKLVVNSDPDDHVSALAYIFQLHPRTVVQQELEDVLRWTYQSLNGVGLSEIGPLLDSMEAKRFVVIGAKYKIFVKDPWWCQLLVISSLKYCLETFEADKESSALILRKSIQLFRPHEQECIHLLKLLIVLIDLGGLNWSTNVALELLTFVSIVGLSPFAGFKQYAEQIAKRALLLAEPSQVTKVLNMDYLPIRGIPTNELERYIRSANLQSIVTRIIELFANNIENREGGVLYKILLSLLAEDFEGWKSLVWQQFFAKLQGLTCEGEFFQSLLKYWIPQSVVTYQLNFYRFVSGAPVGDMLKGHVLLEVKRKFLLSSYSDEDLVFLTKLFSREATRGLAFQIVCSHFKTSSLPSATELRFTRQYLAATSGPLDRREMRALGAFLAHIGNILASRKVPESLKKTFKQYMLQLFLTAKSQLKTGRISLAAQILEPLWNGRVEFKASPDEPEGQLLRQINSDEFRLLLEQSLLSTTACSEELSRVAALVVEEPQLISNAVLFQFIDEMSSALSVQGSNSVKHVASFIGSVNSKSDPNGNSQLQADLEAGLMKLFECSRVQPLNLQNVFKAALLLEALNQLPICTHQVEVETFSTWLSNVYFPAVAAMLPEKPDSSDLAWCQDERLNLKTKNEKIMEALYNNLCQYLFKHRRIWDVVDYPKLLDALVLVIEYSSLRRSTTTSAILLKYAVMMRDSEQERLQGRQQQAWANLKTDLLHETLLKLEKVSPVQNLTIRRNPESRLILHALCLADSSLQKTVLTTTLARLLHLLGHKPSSCATVSAALHCTEALMADNDIYLETLCYAPAVIMQCVDHFENRNWIVRNACMQLNKALIDRFLGVVIGPNNRSRSVSDLFQMFPQLAISFFQILSRTPLSDSALAIMQFFIESQVKLLPFPTRFQTVTRKSFLQLFKGLIKERSDLYGIFAAKAFASLCFARDIPNIVQHVVEVIITDFRAIRSRHVVRNFLVLLKELLDKYGNYMSDKPKPGRMQKSLLDLRLFLEKLQLPELFDCLLLKVQPVAVLQEHCLDLSNNYKDRMWLNNYMPCLVLNCASDELSSVLKSILSQQLPEFLQVKLLSLFLDRFLKSGLPEGQSTDVLNCLILQAVSLSMASTYLLTCYFKVLLFLFESCKHHQYINDQVLQMMRQNYDSSLVLENPYRTFIFHLTLARVLPKSAADKEFAKRATLVRFDDDEDLIEDTSRMLKYFYQNSESASHRKAILSMAVRLLVGHGTWNFVGFITKKRIPTALRAFELILNYDVLIGVFGSDQLAIEFVNEAYQISSGKEATSDNKTFYAVEPEVFVTVGLLNRTVAKFVHDFYTKRQFIDNKLK